MNQAHYPLWIGFLGLPVDLSPFLDMFIQRFGKILIGDPMQNSLCLNLRVCIEVDLNKMWHQHLKLFTVDNLHFMEVNYWNLLNACFVYVTQDHQIRDFPQGDPVRHPHRPVLLHRIHQTVLPKVLLDAKTATTLRSQHCLSWSSC